MKKDKDFSSRLHDAVENYYHYNPDTLMPLMMVALAMKGNIRIIEGNYKPEIAVCELNPKEIIGYDWVCYDVPLKKRVSKWIKDGVTSVAVEMEIGRNLLPLFNTFKRNDEKDVVREYHHRIGRLVHHSNNEVSENAQRQYATFVLAEALLNTPLTFLKKQYLHIFNHILVKSGIQPKRPRLYVAHVLKELLQYDGKGLVYNPFAGCSIAGALLQSKNNFYGDGDNNDKVYAAGLLLNYGMGVSNEHFLQRDSTRWLIGKKIDYVITTYTGHIDGKSAFDFCLGKCLNDPEFKGRYAGMALPKEFFERETSNFKEALKRDWIETIALLPFGEVAILVNAAKTQQQKGVIRVIDSTNPLARDASIPVLLSDDMFAEIVKLKDAKKNGFLKSLFVSELPDREGYEKVRLGDIVAKIPRLVYCLDDFEEEQHVLAYINRNEVYMGVGFPNENIERKTIHNLFSPAYYLDKDCLIVNASGPAEPRIFRADFGSAFFEDGYAFSLEGFSQHEWLIDELKESYVRKQLHPYGLNQMVPEPVTEEDYMNLILYKAVYEDSEEIENDHNNEPKRKEKVVTDALPTGFELKDGNKKFTILNFIAPGAFGYTYRAEMLNCTNGFKEIVAIKEFYPTYFKRLCLGRENNRIVYDSGAVEDFNKLKSMFQSEPEFIRSMADIPDNHVTEVKYTFESDVTGTAYYVMKYYAGESLKDMIIAEQVPSSEQLIMDKIVVPLCKALNAMHSHYILHLDIKPDNIVIDENGEAVLIDFGVAQQYDKTGRLISIRECPSGSAFSAPENRDGNMRYFGPQADIFGAAATLFTLVSGGKWPSPIRYSGDVDYDLNEMKCSEEMKRAIIEGLSYYTNDRPANARLFLNLFPGGENIKLG